jgi:hypothetical protein
LRTTRRDFVKLLTSSGIALSISRLASAGQPDFAAREILPGRENWNPAASGRGRIDAWPKVTGAKLYASDFRAADLPGWPQNASHAMLIRTADATHVLTGIDLSLLTGALKPSVVVTADDLARIGARVPEYYAGDLLCPVGKSEAIIFDVHPNAECSDGGKFFDYEADSLCCCGEASISCQRMPALTLGYKYLSR